MRVCVRVSVHVCVGGWVWGDRCGCGGGVGVGVGVGVGGCCVCG